MVIVLVVSLSNVIDKFSFATDGNATDVGDLTVARYKSAGQSSQRMGYTTASEGSPSVTSNVIDKFSFATDGNATDVGDMSVHRFGRRSKFNNMVMLLAVSRTY